jgi:hypothetical protein
VTTPKPRLLDLFCGAGGAAMGYVFAGFEVTGVDVVDQPHYPFEFWQGDALAILAGIEHLPFEAIHASPPCQHYANVTAWRGDQQRHEDLVGPVRELLRLTGLPWVLENVPEAPTEGMTLCGSQFGLKVRRHRRFETSWDAHCWLPPCTDHRDRLAFEHKGERAYADAMKCFWMNRDEARQAIPPAYTEFIGRQLMDVISLTDAVQDNDNGSING